MAAVSIFIVLVLFSIGYLAQGLTGGATSTDTIKPTITVTQSPIVPKYGDKVIITAKATDAIGIAKIDISTVPIGRGKYESSAAAYSAKGCSIFGAKTGTCTLDYVFSAGTFEYYATATDTNGNVGSTGAKTFIVSGVGVATLSSENVYKRKILGLGTAVLNFDKQYTNIIKIDFEGIPGGEFCAGAVKLEAIDDGGNIATYKTSRVDAHKTAKKSVDVSSLKIRKLHGSIVGDSNPLTPDCSTIDFFKATITYKIP